MSSNFLTAIYILVGSVLYVRGQNGTINLKAWKAGTIGRKCFACREVVTPEECETTTTCSTDEECVTREFLVGDSVFYSLGCKNERVCDVLRDLRPTTVHGECERCCSTPYCNSHLCKKFDLKQLQCHMGGLLSDPTQSQEVLSCPPGQVCYSTRVETDEGNVRFYMGCAPPMACDNSTDLLYFMNPAVASVEKLLCTECCSESFCNSELCRP